MEILLKRVGCSKASVADIVFKGIQKALKDRLYLVDKGLYTIYSKEGAV